MMHIPRFTYKSTKVYSITTRFAGVRCAFTEQLQREIALEPVAFGDMHPPVAGPGENFFAPHTS